MRAIRVTVTVERVDWQDSGGRPITVSSVTRQAYRSADFARDPADARQALARTIEQAAADAYNWANTTKLWEETEL